MKKFFIKILIFAALGGLAILLYSAPVLAQSCETIHVNFTGQCVNSADNCPGDKQAIDNNSSRCALGQKCCYKTLAPSAIELQSQSEDNIQLQIPLFDFAKTNSIAEYIYKIYQYVLILLIPLTILMIIWGGIQWITAGGDNNKIKSAKAQIISAFVGLFIALFSFIFLNLVGITSLKVPTTAKPAQQQTK
jgi:hypothetical protein